MPKILTISIPINTLNQPHHIINIVEMNEVNQVLKQKKKNHHLDVPKSIDMYFLAFNNI